MPGSVNSHPGPNYATVDTGLSIDKEFTSVYTV